jgi:DNA-binding XRE family transcriptional regulator
LRHCRLIFWCRWYSQNSLYSGQTKFNIETKFLLQEESLNETRLTIALGRVLRQQRKSAQLTQEQLGLAANLQRNYVSELERGEKQASVVTLFKLAWALRLAPHELVRLVAEETKPDPPRYQPRHAGSGGYQRRASRK